MQAGELDLSGKAYPYEQSLDSIRFQPESACESTDPSRLCVYSDIQFTPTGDEPVIKTYVSVHEVHVLRFSLRSAQGTAESRMKRLFRKEAYRQASL